MEISQKRMRILPMVALILTMAVFAAACSKQEDVSPMPAVPSEPTYADYGDAEEIMPETQSPVKIQMPEYDFTYSGEFQDLIQVKETEEPGALVFTVKLSQSEAELFTLHYNTDEGDFITVVEDASGNRISVAFQMNALPEGLSEEDEQLFLTAQETVNEIVATLVLK